ncbi:MAG: response regulator [Spirochaetales bacterium]|uniref:Response regulator n=1 Tax=Candidatus Thalassospirochaeta sargassi TaxID=3119039 RepID=A0AAJ1MN89_9SPIO|nr:response regulator [Spirochaetales bacterium]
MKDRHAGVLIVDDLPFMRTAIRDILNEGGIPVAGEAENGLKCLEFYYRNPVALVLLDITMPVMDGIETLAKLKHLDRESQVIMCSAMGQDKYIIRSIQLGARDFIVKPFKPERIISAVRKAIELNV